MRRLLFISSLALLLGLGCTTRNLYRSYKFPPPPVERWLTYMSRDLNPDAGVEPVEYGGVLVTKDVVYLGSETKGVEAFERESFIRKWQFTVKNGVSSALLKEGNVLYFG